jgi:hypothetical protein
MGRKLLLLALLLFTVLILTGTVFALGQKYGITERREVTFDQPTWVGDVLLPAGKYEVRHTMEGAEHVMHFRQLNVKRPAEARVRCTLLWVPNRIAQTQIGFRQNAANELVLTRMAFEGDHAEHRF